jgi:hypothetical protein
VLIENIDVGLLIDVVVPVQGLVIVPLPPTVVILSPGPINPGIVSPEYVMVGDELV